MKLSLFENLQAGDLEDLVRPYIEIDTFEPKVDDDAIVVAFFVREEDPAQDLSRYIEFGPEEVLDTEVSPAPDENGYYIVFVEMERKDLAKNIIAVLQTVQYITNNDVWKYRAYGQEDKLDLKKFN